MHHTQEDIAFAKTLTCTSTYLLYQCQYLKGHGKLKEGLDFYLPKGPRELVSTKWGNLQGNQFWLHLENSFSNNQNHLIVMVGSELPATGSIQAQVESLLNEDAEDGLPRIT